MLVVNNKHAPDFQNAIVDAACPICLVNISSTEIRSVCGSLADLQLNRAFEQGISIHAARLPTRLVRVLPTTNETKDLTRCVVEVVRDLWIGSERVVNSDVVAQRLFKNGIWQLFDHEAQKQFVKLANDVFKDMHETEFNRYLQRVAGSADWNLLRLPDSEGKNRLKATQSFNRVVRDYKERVLHGRDYPERRKEQLSLNDVIENFIPPED